MNGTAWNCYSGTVATVQQTGIWLVPCPLIPGGTVGFLCPPCGGIRRGDAPCEVVFMEHNENMVYGFALLDVLPREREVREELECIGYTNSEVDELITKHWRRVIC